MPCEPRRPEGRAVDEAALGLFSRVAGWTGRAPAWRVRRLLRSALRPGMRALDIGTGPGIIPMHLQRFYPGVYLIGLDISLEMLKAAYSHGKRRQVPLILLAGAGEFLPFKAETLDVMTSFFVLHHMDQPERLLKEVDRVLKPDGTVLIIDFRRDMSPGLFRLLDTLWQLVFCRSAGRRGFRDSVRSAWRPDEIETILHENDLGRFRVCANRMELWVIRDEA